MPPEYRKEFGDGRVILVKGLDECVLLLNEESLQVARERILGPLNLNSRDGRNARRTFMSSVSRVPRDAQYRFVVPAELAHYAGISKGDAVSIVGDEDWLEIWNADRFVQVAAEGMDLLRDQHEQTPRAGTSGGPVRW